MNLVPRGFKDSEPGGT